MILRENINKIQKVVAKILIFSKNNQEILFLQRKNGQWDLPGGEIEFEETPEECLQRELQEEVGCGVVIKKLLCSQTIILNCLNKPKPKMIYYLSLIFIGSIIDTNKITIRDFENKRFKWIKIDNCRKIKTPNFNKDIIKNFNKRTNKQTIKKYYIKAGDYKIYKEIIL